MTLQRRNLLAGLVTVPLAASAAFAANPSAPCAMSDETRLLLNDWPNLARYAQENEALLVSGKKIDVVFMGDSITQGWPDKRPSYFGEGRICRGIGGQTTPQMLLRMMADGVALKPKLIHIMAGTNDIAGNTGPISALQTVGNIQAMAMLAKSSGIAVLLGSVPPAANFPWRPGLETAQTIVRLNRDLAKLAALLGVHFVDYTAALSDKVGGMKPGFAYDGVHPDGEGYQAMEAVLEPLLLSLLARADTPPLPKAR